MTALAKSTSTKLTRGAGKKKMQAALKAEIDKIDAKLKEFGVDHEIKYRITGTLTNFESPQNTINITSISDINTLARWLAHYEKLQASFEAFRKEFRIPDTHIFTNQNGYLVDNIVHDLRLRIRIIMAYTDQISAYRKIQELNQRKALLKRSADNLLQLYNLIDCDQWKTLMSMKDGSEEDLGLAEEIIKNYELKLKVPMPQKGSLILWYGTQYTVDSTDEDRVTVTMNNGQQITLWWWYTEGCKIIKQ